MGRLSNIDVVRFKEDLVLKYDEARGDEILLKELEHLPLDDKNFIVLHQRNIHSPYENNYKHRLNDPRVAVYSTTDNTLSWQEKNKNAYLNSMRLDDLVINKIIEWSKNILQGESYVFFTSDHSELMGEDGLYGHSHLNLNCAKVPFLFYSIHGDNKFIRKINSIKTPTHYDLGLLIADRLGVQIINPNYVPGKYFIQGLDLYSGTRYIEYNLNSDGRLIFVANK